jgi:hypothetical protein
LKQERTYGERLAGAEEFNMRQIALDDRLNQPKSKVNAMLMFKINSLEKFIKPRE